MKGNTSYTCFHDAEGVCPRVPELLIRSLILPSVTVQLSLGLLRCSPQILGNLGLKGKADSLQYLFPGVQRDFTGTVKFRINNKK